MSMWDPRREILLTSRSTAYTRRSIDTVTRKAIQYSDMIATTVEAAKQPGSRRLQMSEQGSLIARMTSLGPENDAGVLRIETVEDALALMEQHRKAAEHASMTYNQGHAPLHFVRSMRLGGIAATFLGNQAHRLDRRRSGIILGTRYGRQYDPDIWPQAMKDVRVTADVTALLTAQNLDILDTVERAFKPIGIGPDALNCLSSMIQDLDDLRSVPLDAMKSIARQLDDGDLTEEEASQVNPYTVLWRFEGGEPSSTLNFSRFLEIAEQLLPPERRDELLAAISSETEEPARARCFAFRRSRRCAAALKEQ